MGNHLPKILINTIPKSGTHLMLQILTGIPGTSVTPWFYPETFEKIKQMQPGEIGRAHLDYSPNQAQDLHHTGVRIVFVSRDLRDIAVSLSHFVMENRWNRHPLHPYLANHLKTHDERLLAIIQGVKPSPDSLKYGISGWPNIYDYNRDKYGWLKENGICHVTFEDLVRTPTSRKLSIMKIIDYLWSDLQGLKITKKQLLQNMIQNINPSSSGTFRRGKIGSWRDEFKAEHKAAFKKIAGHLLIDWGYEKDLNW